MMNKLSQRRSTAYDLIGVKPSKEVPEIPKVKFTCLTDNFIIGLIDGDGSFYVSFASNRLVLILPVQLMIKTCLTQSKVRLWNDKSIKPNHHKV